MPDHLGDVYVMLLDWFGGVSREDRQQRGHSFFTFTHSHVFIVEPDELTRQEKRIIAFKVVAISG